MGSTRFPCTCASRDILNTGQIKIKRSSVLVVGAGGLGCPAAQYLAAAGIGCIGIVDYDNVEISNLHRQVIHGEGQVGIAKVTSAGLFINSLNSNVKVVTHCLLLNSSNALDIIRQYDVVLDATDNLPSRYLLNDSCVILKKPLVSGSALRFEGQLTVYNHDNGPCYRCLYPSPPPPHTVTNCSEGGVLGVVPGIIGSLQALETLKLITGIGDVLSGKLLLFDGLTASFRVVTLRSHDTNCSVCGDNPTIKELIDYEVFCNSTADDKENQVVLIGENDRISCQEYKAVLDQEAPHVLIDVREPVEYDICHLDNSHNIPLSRLQTQSHTSINSLISGVNPNDKVPVYVICRRGNDSQVAVKILQDALSERTTSVKDIKGGLHCWSASIDSTFPIY